MHTYVILDKNNYNHDFEIKNCNIVIGSYNIAQK